MIGHAPTEPMAFNAAARAGAWAGDGGPCLRFDTGRMSSLEIDVPPHVAEMVRAIALLHAEHHRKSTIAERIVDRATASVGRPRFLLALLVGAILWVLLNIALLRSGFSPPDPPPSGGWNWSLPAPRF